VAAAAAAAAAQPSSRSNDGHGARPEEAVAARDCKNDGGVPSRAAAENVDVEAGTGQPLFPAAAAAAAAGATASPLQGGVWVIMSSRTQRLRACAPLGVFIMRLPSPPRRCIGVAYALPTILIDSIGCPSSLLSVIPAGSE
jgi:hypothetical protein